MKKLLYAVSVILFLSGCAQQFFDGKPLTGQIPSIDKTILEGTKLSAASRTAADGEYPVYERLYDTTWYRTDKEVDDGRIDTTSEFVFFNRDSSIFKVDVLFGRVERPEKDDYATLKPIKEIKYVSENRPDGEDMNAWIVSKIVGNEDRQFEAYWLYSTHILYITEGDTAWEAESAMKAVMESLHEGDDTERFLLSTVSPR